MTLGEVVLQRIRGTRSDRLNVLRADPHTLIDAEILAEIRSGSHHPDVTIDGDVITINAINGKWIYRIGDYEYQHHAYHMQWPD